MVAQVMAAQVMDAQAMDAYVRLCIFRIHINIRALIEQKLEFDYVTHHGTKSNN
jgi:hypothetical protein